MWSTSIEMFNYIESKIGYIYVHYISTETSEIDFEIGVISPIIRAPVCGDRNKLYKLTRPIVFYGRARYKDEVIKFNKPRINKRLRFFIVKNYPFENKVSSISNEFLKKIVFSFKEAHPNVDKTGSLCPGTLGKYSPQWDIVKKATYLVGLMTMVSVPSIDSTLGSYGCKAYKKLREFLPTSLESCLSKKCEG